MPRARPHAPRTMQRHACLQHSRLCCVDDDLNSVISARPHGPRRCRELRQMTWPRFAAFAAALVAATLGVAAAAPLTYGSTLVLRIGSGTYALTSTSTQTVRVRRACVVQASVAENLTLLPTATRAS
jgi:hypothetical protein